MTSRKAKVDSLFKQGYNCSQAVFAAYSDLFGVDEETALRVASSFGGGIGRMRGACGAVTGMCMVAGLATGSTDSADKEAKQHNYAVVQQMVNEFRETAGSIVCRELLGLDENEDTSNTKPDERNKEFYEKRPCAQLVLDAADIIDRVLLKQTEE
ncbi:C-GCAxxG-C-C family protein [Anaerolentibacter hominis]|uniref:C-GCAxxG-C-C family protein n=1 Tax=Anaerolentibacter hominis TaxID=3079009 RepID=UPI0031B81304